MHIYRTIPKLDPLIKDKLKLKKKKIKNAKR